MPFDEGEPDDWEDDDDACVICGGWGLIYTQIPALRGVGPVWGWTTTKRTCPVCMPGVSDCPHCAGLSGPGVSGEFLCNGEVRVAWRATMACPRCSQRDAA